MKGGTCCRFEPRDPSCPDSNPIAHQTNLQMLGNILIGPVYASVFYTYHFFKHIDEVGVPCNFNMKLRSEILYANIVTYLPDAKIKIKVKSESYSKHSRRASSKKNSTKSVSPTKASPLPLLPFETTLWAGDYLVRKILGKQVLDDRADLNREELKSLQHKLSKKSVFKDVIDVLPKGDYVAYIEVSKHVVYRVMFEYKETHLSSEMKTAKITLIHLERKREKSDKSYYAHSVANYDGQESKY